MNETETISVVADLREYLRAMRKQPGAQERRAYLEERIAALTKAPMTQDYYTREGGHNVCPYCRSEDVCAGDHEFAASHATLEVSCSECGRTWREMYRMTGFEGIPVSGA